MKTPETQSKNNIETDKIPSGEIKGFQDLGSRTRELEDSRRALMNILDDVEEARRRAEEESSKTQAIIANFTDGLLMLNRANNLVMINPQAEIFFGVKRKDIIGVPLARLAAKTNFKPLVDLISGQQSKKIFREELRFKENLILEISNVDIVREKEKLGTLIILHDITREKNVEKLKTEFVSLAAHQLRTPLSAIKWTLKMLLTGDLGAITDEQREFIEKSYNSNERMIHLINDLLNVTRLEEGRYVYRISEFKIEEAFLSVLANLREKIDNQQIKLSYQLPTSKLPLISGDREKIEIAIQNMVENAINYSPEGGQVTVKIEGDKKQVTFKVTDNGIGITDSQKERIFGKFFRGDNAMKKDTQGSGLGLFMCKNIIESHGGQAGFESNVGQGSTFFFSLPIKAKIKEEKLRVAAEDGQPAVDKPAKRVKIEAGKKS